MSAARASAATKILAHVHALLKDASLAERCHLNDPASHESSWRSRINVLDAGDARFDDAGTTLSAEGRALEVDIVVSVKALAGAAALARDLVAEVESVLRQDGGTLTVDGGAVEVERVDDEIGVFSDEQETSAIVLTASYSMLYRVRPGDPFRPLP